MTTSQLDPGTDITGSLPDPDAADAASSRASEALAGVRTGVGVARRGMVGLIARLPATAGATQTAARKTVAALQTLPDDTLLSLAATSMGLGIGLSFTRARRLAFVAGMLPAALIRAVIAGRPVEPVPTDVGS